MDSIAAGIVLYNPDINRLYENIEAVLPQVSKLYIFDNGSNNQLEINKLLKKYHGIVYLTEQKNVGIARALNKIAVAAIDDSFDWLLTLDQDSVVLSNIIENYKKYLNLPRVGQLSCLYSDRNKKENIKISSSNQLYENIKYAITSGSLIKLSALKVCGGFDESLFIDWVDMEICCALRAKQYMTYCINFVGFIHELGRPTPIRFLGFHGYTSNYPAFRYFYSARNSILTAFRYPNEEKIEIRILAQIKILIKINLYEKNKKKKSHALIEGIKEGFKNKNQNRAFYL